MRVQDVAQQGQVVLLEDAAQYPSLGEASGIVACCLLVVHCARLSYMAQVVYCCSAVICQEGQHFEQISCHSCCCHSCLQHAWTLTRSSCASLSHAAKHLACVARHSIRVEILARATQPLAEILRGR